MSLNAIHTSSFVKEAPERGPTSSGDYNHAIASIVADLTAISEEWNEKVKPLLNSLPGGDEASSEISESPDAFTSGLDGANIYMDLHASATDADGGWYYDNVNKRPLSIKEIAAKIRIALNDSVNTIRSDINTAFASGNILTSAQKNRIGAGIFYSTKTSSPTSLDGRVTVLENHDKHFHVNGITTPDASYTLVGYIVRTEAGGGGPETAANTLLAVAAGSAEVFIWDGIRVGANKVPYVAAGLQISVRHTTSAYRVLAPAAAEGTYTFAFGTNSFLLDLSAGGITVDEIIVNAVLPLE